MPTYEYRCDECDHIFEQDQTYMRRKDAICTKCSSNNCLLLASLSSVVFTGMGWYETDYKKKTSRKHQPK